MTRTELRLFATAKVFAIVLTVMQGGVAILSFIAALIG